MRWRKRQQARILKALRATLRHEQLAEVGFAIPCKVLHISSDCILIDCNVRTFSGDEFTVSATASRMLISVGAHATTVLLDFCPHVQIVDLVVGDGLRLFKVDLTINPPPLKQFGLSPRREDPGLFGSQHDSTQRTTRLRPIPKVHRESAIEKRETLEERLRWILTPPVHELLSDPRLGLPHTPYDYQVRGIAWLRAQDSALLADEMGLGKTMQAIISARLLWRDHQIDRILIVCPKTLIRTWRQEIAMWWPNVTPNLCEPTGDTQGFLKRATSNVTIKIINYEKLQREADWLAKGERCGSHDLIIIDEAQRIKNPSSKTAKAVKALKGARRWALTGTPLETKAGDVVSIFDFVRPGTLEHDDPDHVRERIRPFFLRRRVEEVDLDLPDKDDHDVEVELTLKQREAYERAEDEGVIALNSKGDTITVQHVFALIQKLMQLCNFDAASGESTKLDRLIEDMEEIIESGRKALVFSQFVSEPFGLKQLKKGLPSICNIVEMHGGVSQGKRDAAIDAFTVDPAVNTMLLHYRVGGVGLNLQAANYVYLFDRWWNPAVEDQAVKRAHRIGQGSTVFVRRFYCVNTIEDRILRKLEERRRLFSHIIDEGRPHETMGLGEEELFSLFKNLKARPRRLQTKTRAPRIVLDNVDPQDFEHLVASLYEAQGFTVRVVGGSHDGGVDIEAERSNATGHDRIVIQCKHTKATVGRPEVQKLFGVISDNQALTRGDLVTSSDFSAEAREFARGKRIELINRQSLIKLANESGSVKFVDV